MSARQLQPLAFALAFVAFCHLCTVNVTAHRPGHSIYYPYSTLALPGDNAPPRPVDIPLRAVAAAPAPVDQNRRSTAGPAVVAVMLMGLAALASMNALA